MSNKFHKICHIQLLPLMSGVQRAMLEILSRLERERYQPFVVCKETGALTEQLQKMDIEYMVVPHLLREIRLHRDCLAVNRLYRFFKHQQFDIVHTHSSKPGFLGRLAAKWASVNHVFHTVQGLPFHEFSSAHSKRLYVLAEKVAARWSDKIIFVNHEERKLAITKGIVPADKAVTIHNGVDLQKVKDYDQEKNRNAFRRERRIAPNEFVVGYVGRLWRQKDPETLIKIIELCADLPVTFLIVGDGPYLPILQDLARRNNNIILTGWLQEPFIMYPAIDALLLPSLWEGLPITLLEAMAFGKPLIASNIKGNRECVRTGENGFLCEPKNAVDFKDAIVRLLHDRDLRSRLGKNSRELCRQHFDADTNAREVIRLYETALADDRLSD